MENRVIQADTRQKLKHHERKERYFESVGYRVVHSKWSMYDPEQINRVLGVYDLKKEPRAGRATRAWFNGELREGWETECRRLNPKAWERKRRRANETH